MNRFALCLLLLSLSAFAHARDVRMHGPNGDGGAESSAASVQPPAPAKQPAANMAHDKGKTPPLFRGGDDDAVPHAPRWHSFLPGMFR